MCKQTKLMASASVQSALRVYTASINANYHEFAL